MTSGLVTDVFGRRIRDLRISVTDRCNFRCGYCMPPDREYDFLSRDELLSFEEITRLVRVFAGLGAVKIRITGGEPLLRPNLEDLLERISAVDEIRDLAMTTNGYLLARHAGSLREAGLDRVTVSLDALEEQTFADMANRDFGLEEALEGIRTAREAGLEPVKVNMVVQRDRNDDQVLDMARHFKGTGVILRFIEYMDVGTLNGWRVDDVVPSRELVERIHAELPLVPVGKHYPGEVADRYRYLDGSGEIGFISSVSQPFCGSCTRARLSASGELYTCLFGTRGHDLREPLRSGASDRELTERVREIWSARRDRYSEQRTAETDGLKVPASGLLQLRTPSGNGAGPGGDAGEEAPAGAGGERVEMFRIGG